MMTKGLLNYGIGLVQRYFPSVFTRKAEPTEVYQRQERVYDYNGDREEYNRAFAAGEVK